MTPPPTLPAGHTSGASLAQPLLTLPEQTSHYLDASDLLSLEAVDALPASAVPAVVAQLAARQAYLAALQSRAAARLVTKSAIGSTPDDRIAPGQRLNANQLAKRMGRSVDYVYRHAKDWPFTVREDRAVSFDEAGFVRWQRQRMTTASRRF